MKRMRKVNMFYVSLATILLFFVWKQVNSILQVDIFNGLELDPHYLSHGLSIVLIVLVGIILTYLLPLLIVIEIMSLPKIPLPPLLQTVFTHIQTYKNTIIQRNRNQLYCVIRC